MERTTSVFAGVAALAVLVVGATVAFFPVNPSTPQSLILDNSASTGSASGLVLRYNLNSSVIAEGRNITMSVGEWNSRAAENTIESSKNWPVEGLGVGPCGPLNLPFGYEVLYGYYNASSTGLESAQRVQLYAPGPYGCPAILSGISSYSFYPRSDRANVTGSCEPELCFAAEMNATAVLGEYWNGGSFAPLTPGTYTVVVGDEWGTILFGHIEVTSVTHGETVVLPEGTALRVSMSYDCVAGHYSLGFDAGYQSVFTGAFSSEAPGVTLYVATPQQASDIFQGHPSSWVYSTGLVNSSRFAVGLPPGSYVVWIEGADLNCGSQIVMPLERLLVVNVTEAFVASG